MRTCYRVHEPDAAHFITSTIVNWLPVFTTAACCDILVASLAYCREQKGLRVYGWVIMDNHFHAIVAAPELPRVMADLKRHTAKHLLAQVEREGRVWLATQLGLRRARHKLESDHQVWQEGYHPQAIQTDETMIQKLDYMHRNPVKRGLVEQPEHWVYSSAHVWMPGARVKLRCDEWRG